MFSKKYFISKYTIGDAGRRKNTVLDSQRASWRTCEPATYQAQRRKTSGYTWTTNEEMTGTLCSRTDCPEPDTYCVSSKTTQRHRGHTGAWDEYGSNNWNRSSTSTQYSVISRMAKQQVRITFSQSCWNTLKQSYHTRRSCLTLYHGRAKKFPHSGKNGMIVPLPKKGDLSYCNNWRGITLLSVAGSVCSCTCWEGYA